MAAEAERLLADPSSLVRGAAVWALSRLLDAAAFEALRSEREAMESDPAAQVEWIPAG